MKLKKRTTRLLLAINITVVIHTAVYFFWLKDQHHFSVTLENVLVQDYHCNLKTSIFIDFNGHFFFPFHFQSGKFIYIVSVCRKSNVLNYLFFVTIHTFPLDEDRFTRDTFILSGLMTGASFHFQRKRVISIISLRHTTKRSCVTCGMKSTNCNVVLWSWINKTRDRLIIS